MWPLLITDATFNGGSYKITYFSFKEYFQTNQRNIICSKSFKTLMKRPFCREITNKKKTKKWISNSYLIRQRFKEYFCKSNMPLYEWFETKFTVTLTVSYPVPFLLVLTFYLSIRFNIFLSSCCFIFLCLTAN